MRLARLKLANVRNLRVQDLRPSSAVNIFQGPNASGKSSLLEAVYILSCGKSFRTRHLSHVLNYQAPEMTISGEVVTAGRDTVPIGVEFERGRSRTRVRARGRSLHKTSDLATLLPVVTLHQESHRVFTEGPAYRRQFLDWGLFHVEPSFLPAWQRYRRALKQRNSALQTSTRTEIWDTDLGESALVIDRLRRQYLGRLMPIFTDLSSLLKADQQVVARYERGWEDSMGFSTMLSQSLPGDRALGYTRHGPHRADISFMIGDTAVGEYLSRGQLKVLVYALYLAQAVAYTESTGERSLILMDDLTAELDDFHIGRLLEKLAVLRLQVFITSSEHRLVEHVKETEYKMFHVERGTLTEVV